MLGGVGKGETTRCTDHSSVLRGPAHILELESATQISLQH